MKKIKNLIILLFLALLCFNPTCAYSLLGEEKLSFKIEEGTIISPLPTSPQILKKGGILNVVYKGKEEEKLQIFLDNRYGEKLQIPIVSQRHWQGIWYAEAKTDGIEEHLYDVLVVSQERESRAKRALKIINKFPDKFSFIHITDTHIPLEEGGYHPAKVHLPYFTSDKILPKLVEEINLLNPEFVLITGDCIASGEDITRMLKLFSGPVSEYARKKIARLVEEEYEQFLEFINQFNVPTYVLPGNHDMSGIINEISRSIWETRVGKRYFSFNFGDYYFAGLDNSNMMEAIGIVYPYVEKVDFDEEQINWLKQDLEKNKDKKMKTFFFHVPIEKVESVIKMLIKEYNISLILAGHMHRDVVRELPRGSGRLWIETKSVLDFGGYRLIRVGEGKTLSHSIKGTKDSSLTTFNLNVNYKKEKRKIAAEITNNYEEEFEHSQVKFEIPKNKKYKIINGEIKKKIVQKDKEILFVNYTIKPKDKTTVEVRW